MTALHYAATSYLLGEYEPEQVAVCGNDRRRSKKLTENPREVTCPRCRRLAGIDDELVAEYRSGFLELCDLEEERLTEVHGDPFPKRRAA
jgi:hypothetical protein